MRCMAIRLSFSGSISKIETQDYAKFRRRENPIGTAIGYQLFHQHIAHSGNEVHGHQTKFFRVHFKNRNSRLRKVSQARKSREAKKISRRRESGSEAKD